MLNEKKYANIIAIKDKKINLKLILNKNNKAMYRIVKVIDS